MENNIETTEYQNEIALLKEGSTDVAPSRESLKALLAKIPTGVASPYSPKKSPFWTFNKIATAMLVVIAAISGGSFFFSTNNNGSSNSVAVMTSENTVFDAMNQNQGNRSFSATAPTGAAVPAAMMMAGNSGPTDYVSSDSSDEGLAQDQQNIAAQMTALQTDTANANSTSV